MTTYEIYNSITGEVVDTAQTHIDAMGIAAFLTHTTRTPHHVPAVVPEWEMEFAV